MSNTVRNYDPYDTDDYGERSKRIRQMRKQAKQFRKASRQFEREIYGETRDEEDANTSRSR